MIELELIKQIDIFISTIVFSLAVIFQIILLFFSYYYLPKFEKKHDLAYKGYRSFFTRSLHVAVLNFLSISKPGSHYRAKLYRRYKNTEYEKFLNIPHENLKWFRVSFWLLVSEGIFMFIMLALIGLDKLLSL